MQPTSDDIPLIDFFATDIQKSSWKRYCVPKIIMKQNSIRLHKISSSNQVESFCPNADRSTGGDTYSLFLKSLTCWTTLNDADGDLRLLWCGYGSSHFNVLHVRKVGACSLNMLNFSSNSWMFPLKCVLFKFVI